MFLWDIQESQVASGCYGVPTGKVLAVSKLVQGGMGVLMRVKTSRLKHVIKASVSSGH